MSVSNNKPEGNCMSQPLCEQLVKMAGHNQQRRIRSWPSTLKCIRTKPFAKFNRSGINTVIRDKTATLTQLKVGFLVRLKQIINGSSTGVQTETRESGPLDSNRIICLFLGKSGEHRTDCRKVQLSQLCRRAVSGKRRQRSCRTWFTSITPTKRWAIEIRSTKKCG